MKIAVIAANGRSGQAFVKQALAAGHTVRGGILGKSTLEPHERLVTVECDATRQSDLQNLIHGVDAVVSLIGHVKGSTPHVQTDAIATLVIVMKQEKISRVVSLTGTGVRFKGDHITLADRVLNFGVGIAIATRVNDGIDHATVLQESGIDWTIIRVLKLRDIPKKPFTLREHGPTKPYVGREEVASAILEVLEQKSFIQKAPIIGKP